jgi:hypothetical protein
MQAMIVLASFALAACTSQPSQEVFIPTVPNGTIRAVCDERAADARGLTEQERLIAAWHCGDGENFAALYGRPDASTQNAVLTKAERSGRDSLHLEEVQILDYTCAERSLEASYCGR